MEKVFLPWKTFLRELSTGFGRTLMDPFLSKAMMSRKIEFTHNQSYKLYKMRKDSNTFFMEVFTTQMLIFLWNLEMELNSRIILKIGTVRSSMTKEKTIRK